MKRSLFVLPLAATTALALAGAHFLWATASLNSPNLRIDFREAGLGDNQTIVYLGTAHSDATYACINGGDENPNASNKRSVSGDVAGTGTFTSGKNGSLRGFVHLNPVPSDLRCPPGQTRVLAEASYSNVAITDTYNNVSEAIPGTYSATFVDLD